MNYWRLFIKKTTIHGLRFITKKRKYGHRVWALIFLVSLMLCLWQSAFNIDDYLKYNVRTTTTFTTASELEFPAITFWNSNRFRRTILGRQFATKWMLSQFSQLNFSKVDKTCNYRPEQRDNMDNLIDSMMKNFTRAIESRGLNQETIDLALKLILVNREMTFVKCWFKQKEMNCDKLVLNSIISTINYLVPSFTVNLASNLVEAFRNKNVLGFSLQNEGYKPNDDMISWSDGIGMANGYNFLLNAQVDEYCLSSHNLWYGVGLHATFHGRHLFPNEDDDIGTVYLAPGFQYSVALKPKIYNRQTEHIGKCVSNYDSYLFPVSSVYNKVWCLMQCVLETEWKYCHCTTMPMQHLLETFANHHGINVSTIESCWTEPHIKCYVHLTVWGAFANKKYCSHCKQPCQETIFDFDVTAVAFPPKHLAKYYKQILNHTHEEEVGKNYIMLNVFFESKSVNIITDTQMYTVRELFIYLGNNAILFLGMSFMSFYETVHLIFRILHLAMVQRKKIKKKRRRVKRHPWRYKNKRNRWKRIIRVRRTIRVRPMNIVTPANTSAESQSTVAVQHVTKKGHSEKTSKS